MARRMISTNERRTKTAGQMSSIKTREIKNSEIEMNKINGRKAKKYSITTKHVMRRIQ